MFSVSDSLVKVLENGIKFRNKFRDSAVFIFNFGVWTITHFSAVKRGWTVTTSCSRLWRFRWLGLQFIRIIRPFWPFWPSPINSCNNNAFKFVKKYILCSHLELVLFKLFVKLQDCVFVNRWESLLKCDINFLLSFRPWGVLHNFFHRTKEKDRHISLSSWRSEVHCLVWYSFQLTTRLTTRTIIHRYLHWMRDRPQFLKVNPEFLLLHS